MSYKLTFKKIKKQAHVIILQGYVRVRGVRVRFKTSGCAQIVQKTGPDLRLTDSRYFTS